MQVWNTKNTESDNPTLFLSCVRMWSVVVFTFAGEAMRCDPRQAVFTDIAEGGPCVGAGVPVVHPWEMFHIKLCRLTKEKLKQVGSTEKKQSEKSKHSALSDNNQHILIPSLSWGDTLPTPPPLSFNAWAAPFPSPSDAQRAALQRSVAS